MTTHFISLLDIPKDTIISLVERACETKLLSKQKLRQASCDGKVFGLIFEKPSTRTRFSFEVAAHQLGAKAIYIKGDEVGFGKRESLADVAKVMSRYFDAIMIRANSHETVTSFASYSSIPIINGLTDFCHPCQALADLVTVKENGYALDAFKMTYVGDGNNVCQSLIFAAEKLGFELTVCCPEGFEPKLSDGSHVAIKRDLLEAVKGADFVYTDVWTSMGQEAETDRRKRLFRPYQVNLDVLKSTGTTSFFLHCLPAHRGEEVGEGVLESEFSLVFDQAENRMHAQRSLLEWIWSN